MQAQSLGIQIVLVTSKLLLIFCFPLIFVLYSIIFKNIFLSFQISFFQNQNPNFILYISLFKPYHTLSFKSYYHSNFPFCTESLHSPTSLSFFSLYKYLSFFP